MTQINITTLPGLAYAIGAASALASGMSNMFQGKPIKGAVQTVAGAGVIAMTGTTLKTTAAIAGILGLTVGLYSQGFNKLAKAIKDRDAREAAKAVGYFGAGTAVGSFVKVNLSGAVVVAFAAAASSLSGYLWNRACEKIANAPIVSQSLHRGAACLVGVYNKYVGPNNQIELVDVANLEV